MLADLQEYVCSLEHTFALYFAKYCVRASLLRNLLARCVKLSGAHNEALWRRAYKMKRKARDECQVVTGRWLQYMDVVGRNDFN